MCVTDRLYHLFLFLLIYLLDSIDFMSIFLMLRR